MELSRGLSDTKPVNRGARTRINVDGSTEPISCGDDVDDEMSALCSTQLSKQVVGELSPVIVGAEDRTDVEPVSSTSNGSNSRALPNENVTPELPNEGMVKKRSQSTEDSQNKRIADRIRERRAKIWLAWNTPLRLPLMMYHQTM